MSDIVIIPVGESTPILPSSPAFAHGFGLFETMCFADERIYFWRDHWARLCKSAKYFALLPPKEASVLAALREYVTESGLEEATLKLSLMRESEGSRLYVYSRPPIPSPDNRRLRLERSYPLFAGSALAGHKTHNYMEAMHLLSLARAQGDDDLVRVDSEGFLAETTSSNLFFVKEGRIHTPSLDTGILPGVTRAALLRCQDFAVVEGRYLPEALLGAEAVFVTNATKGLLPIERIEGFSGGESVDFRTDGPFLRSIEAAYAHMRTACSKQLI